MATIKTYNLTKPELEDLCNQVKDVLLNNLTTYKIISKDQVEKLSKTKVIMIKKKSAISHFFKKLVGKGEEEGEEILVGTLKWEENDEKS